MSRIVSMVALLGLLGAQVPSMQAGDAVATSKSDGKLAPLNPQETVLLDAAGKRLLLKGEICLREGQLEMLACLKRTKEHESILSVDAKAQTVHAGLLALGLEPGKPVQHVPDFKPPTGPVIEIQLFWDDEAGNVQRMPAQKWVRNSTRRYWLEKLDPPPSKLAIPADSDLRWDEKRKELIWYGAMNDAQRDALLKLSDHAGYQKAIRTFHKQTQTHDLDSSWVFAGSSVYVDPKTKEAFYQAESGDLICVANFATATLDLSIPSSAQGEELLWEAHTARIPPVGTKVTIELHAPAEKRKSP